MDRLQMIASAYQMIMQKQYYFEIAKKNTLHKFILSFEKTDFFHIAGFHKLKDVTVLQIKKNKGLIFDKIQAGDITFEQIKNSFFYDDIRKRLAYTEKLQELLDSNQIVFQYLENKNMASHIKADFLLEEGYKKDIVYVFLSERNMNVQQNIPTMCCRSFFPMNQLDYSRNQPSYTLLKKVKLDTVTGERLIQYDRSKILEQAKTARTEPERRSIMQQLNEKKAQLAIKEVLDEKKFQRDERNHERY